ncbi:hypothetical protein GLYMA_09G237400v4 [Glycine max]|uniref:Uncharacterized protein n=1 Tax=Glycine max TaxID=3847 RepID=A0A0R0IJ61_SOYBN|nr:hypothetical protein GYH30_025986 [Glycine max]KRH40088.1 hypothetical protein GLYMA_09G237400v4 [Glycine max]
MHKCYMGHEHKDAAHSKSCSMQHFHRSVIWSQKVGCGSHPQNHTTLIWQVEVMQLLHLSDCGYLKINRSCS